jgi:antitoxin MazE6
MKTAVSLPDDLFRRAEAAAHKLSKTRSELYREALAEYLLRHSGDDVRQQMDSALLGITQGEDPWLTEAARQALQRSEW